MKAEYEDLFKILAKSYYKGNFNDKITELISDPNTNKEYLCRIISSLCGVSVNLEENFTYKLKEAIKNYNPNHKIVNKIRDCSDECISNSDKTPCQKSCPFDAIIMDKEKNNYFIDSEICTDCGSCVEACHEGNILDKIQFLPLVDLLKSNTPVVAAVAPAIMGQFGEKISINQLRSAFKKVGFFDMVEVAFFADMITLKEAVEFNNLVKNENDFMITSCCCPMWVGMLKKVYNNLVKYVSPSISPMIASGRVLKKLNPDCKVVFIGPCVAKKAEAKEKDIIGEIDFVMTFDEIKNVFEVLNINPSDLEEDISTEYSSKGGRLYARTGGVSKAVCDTIKIMFPEKQVVFNSIQANGVVECKELLAKVQSEKDTEANFIEGMGCVGGCVGGPKVIIPKEEGRKRVNEFAESCKINIPLDSTCMNLILQKLDIHSPDDFKYKDRIKIFEREF